MLRCLLLDTTNGQTQSGAETLLEQWFAAGGTAASHLHLWLDLENEPLIEERALLKDRLHIDPLAISDAQRTRHPPKVEEFGHYRFILLKGLSRESASLDFKTIQIAIFLGSNFLITRRAEHSVSTERAWQLAATDPSVIRHGLQPLVPTIARFVVDRYLSVLTALEPRLDALEVELMESPSEAELAELTGYKTRLKKMRRTLIYHEAVFRELRRSVDSTPEHRHLKHLYTDAYEHHERAASLAMLYLELASDLMDSSITLASHRLNGVMKVLTIITAVFVPLSFLAGVYGMNFDIMPELHTQHGYYWVLGVMAGIAVASLAAFRWKRWL